MVRFLSSVGVHDTHPAVWLAIGIAYGIRRSHLGLPDDLWVTSMNDGQSHMASATSLHNPANTPDRLCRAVDLRTYDLELVARWKYYLRVKEALRPLGFDTVLHLGERVLEGQTADGVPEHLHLEFQPKTLAERVWFPQDKLIMV